MGNVSNKYYIDNVKNQTHLAEQINPLTFVENTKNELSINRNLLSYDHGVFKIYYISDIHLDHKILKKFPVFASKLEITKYIKSLVKEMISEFSDLSEFIRPYIFISGDLTYNFTFSKVFYEELRSLLPNANIFIVLGNHELWDITLTEKANTSSQKVDSVIKKYKGLLNKLNIHMIQNELVVYKYSGNFNPLYDVYRLDENEILKMSKEELREFVKSSRLTILGGIAFTGYAAQYNALKGLYREAITDLDNDIIQTKRFESIYNKCKTALDDYQVIVLTHTPKENWSKDEYCKNWIYVNGHTHQNKFVNTAEKTVYADNQIGYYKKSLGFKHLYCSGIYDIFTDYKDGIYEISKEEFQDFYSGKGSGVSYSRKGTKIYMLKKNEIYCFIQKYIKTGSLCILNGGSPVKLKPQRELEYYYEKLDVYTNAVQDFLDIFDSSLQEVSTLVRSFGGSGRIHGFIVDIDSLNHLYLNPFDGKVTPYYATSINDKYVYKNIASLLRFRNIGLYNKYQKLLESGKDLSKFDMVPNEHQLISKSTIHSVKTEIYKFSRIAKGLQYLSQIKVIRIWNDNLMEKRSEDVDSRVLITDLIGE
ncbi:MAG: hypothetical protein KQ78_01319 [Candidatus Izimaplasma bacterium HR2]|nr:MAG: hypothetical protein KQ78_01319 [Candidatus Izimaplasma bacterium HR2]